MININDTLNFMNPLKVINSYLQSTMLYFWAAAIAAYSAYQSSQDQASAAKSAAGTQAAATEAATAEQRRQFDVTQQQAEPFRQAELAALQQQEPLRAEALRQQAALTGLSGQAAQQQALTTLEESPGQQFLRQRQERALLRNQAAIGGLGGGNVRTALQEQAAGFAQQDLQNQFARLGGFTGAQGVGTTQNLATLGAQQATNIGNLALQRGQAEASGILGAQQARSQFSGQLQGGLRGAGFASQTPGVTTQQGFLAGFR